MSAETAQSAQPAQIAHFEIAGPDNQAVVAFYGRPLGWTADSRGPGYTLLQRSSTRNVPG